MYKKHFLFYFIFLSICCSASHSAQPIYLFCVDFENVCGFPIQVTVQNYTNVNAEPEKMEQNLNPGEKIRTLGMIAYTNRVEAAVLPSYGLEISTNTDNVNINSVRLIELLQNLKKEQNSSQHSSIWIIKDPSLCPRL